MSITGSKARIFAEMWGLLNDFAPSRELSLARTKLDECQMWLDRCEPSPEAMARELAGGRTYEDIPLVKEPISGNYLERPDPSGKAFSPVTTGNLEMEIPVVKPDPQPWQYKDLSPREYGPVTTGEKPRASTEDPEISPEWKEPPLP